MMLNEIRRGQQLASGLVAIVYISALNPVGQDTVAIKAITFTGGIYLLLVAFQLFHAKWKFLDEEFRTWVSAQGFIVLGAASVLLAQFIAYKGLVERNPPPVNGYGVYIIIGAAVGYALLTTLQLKAPNKETHDHQ